MVIKPDIELYGVYIPGENGPQAQFRSLEDAHSWGKLKYSTYGIFVNFAYWDKTVVTPTIEYINVKKS